MTSRFQTVRSSNPFKVVEGPAVGRYGHRTVELTLEPDRDYCSERGVRSRSSRRDEHTRLRPEQGSVVVRPSVQNARLVGELEYQLAIHHEERSRDRELALGVDPARALRGLTIPSLLAFDLGAVESDEGNIGKPRQPGLLSPTAIAA